MYFAYYLSKIEKKKRKKKKYHLYKQKKKKEDIIGYGLESGKSAYRFLAPSWTAFFSTGCFSNGGQPSRFHHT